jgi:hypothetical protein
MMKVQQALRWCCILLCLAGVCVGLHFYGEHRLERAHARLARAMSLPALPAPCRLPEGDSRNAAFWYLSAGSAYMDTRKGLDLTPLVNQSPTTWSARDIEQAASDLVKINRTLELAYEAGSRPVCDFRVVASDPVDMREEVLVGPLLLDVGFQLRHRRLERAVQAIKVLGDLGFGLERQQNALSQSVGRIIEIGYLRGLNWILSAPDVPPGLLRSLRAGLSSKGPTRSACLRRTRKRSIRSLEPTPPTPGLPAAASLSPTRAPRRPVANWACGVCHHPSSGHCRLRPERRIKPQR